MICKGCGNDDDCRMGFCFDCASAGEERAAKRSVTQHLFKAAVNFSRGSFTNSRICLKWAYERATKTGDYAPDGEFDRQGYI